MKKLIANMIIYIAASIFLIFILLLIGAAIMAFVLNPIKALAICGGIILIALIVTGIFALFDWAEENR